MILYSIVCIPLLLYDLISQLLSLSPLFSNYLPPSYLDIDTCKKGHWFGNEMKSKADWKKRMSPYTTLIEPINLKRKDRPKAEIEEIRPNNAPKLLATSSILLLLTFVVVMASNFLLL